MIYSNNDIIKILWNTFKTYSKSIKHIYKNEFHVILENDVTFEEITDILEEMFESEIFDVTLNMEDKLNPKVIVQYLEPYHIEENLITSINEFIFSNHYAYDKDNRFDLRIRKSKLVNTDINNISLAETRFKKVMFYYGLEIMDKLNISAIDQPLGIVFGNIYFRENKKLIQAKISIEDKLVGNVYVAIIKNSTIVTVLLLPFGVDNKEIADKALKHDGTVLKNIFDINGNKLSFDDKKKNNVIIDLDINDEEFLSIYPPININNKQYGKLLTDSEKQQINADLLKLPQKETYSPIVIPQDLKKFVPEKEFVIYKGKKILVPYPDGPKEKIIRDLVIDETGSTRKYSLIFENTLKPFVLDKDIYFIISPVLNNDEYKQLLNAFDLPDGKQFNFQGKITKFNFYSKEKTKSIPKLGIIINPSMFF